MATKKVTITLDETDLEKIAELVRTRQAASVSGFIQHAVKIGLDDITGWGAMLAEALEQTGGPLTPKEKLWADKQLDSRAAKAKRKRTAA